jgi:uncharacterized HAD superfamily protein
LIIGVDLDGTITNNNWYKGKTKLPWWFIALGLEFLEPFVWPRKEIVDNLRNRAELNNDKIIIISLRPKELEYLTRRVLLKYKIPFHQLHLVGVGKGGEERKLKIIKNIGIEYYFDDDLDTVTFLRRNGIKAYHSTYLMGVP